MSQESCKESAEKIIGQGKSLGNYQCRFDIKWLRDDITSALLAKEREAWNAAIETAIECYKENNDDMNITGCLSKLEKLKKD